MEDLISTLLILLGGPIFFIVCSIKFFKVLETRKRFRKNIISIIIERPDARNILENLIIKSAKQEIERTIYLGFNSESAKIKDLANIEINLKNKLQAFSQEEVQNYFLDNVISERKRGGGKALISMNFRDRELKYLQTIGLAGELNDSSALEKIAQQYKIYKDSFSSYVKFFLLFFIIFSIIMTLRILTSQRF